MTTDYDEDEFEYDGDEDEDDDYEAYEAAYAAHEDEKRLIDSEKYHIYEEED